MKTKPNINANALARHITAALTTNGDGEHAERLLLRDKNWKYLGGLSVESVVDTIHRVLKAHLKKRC